MNKTTSILEWVETYPETENTFRAFDSIVGTCILCHCLFESIDEIEKKYHVDLSELLNRLNSIVQN